jgi:hypothetical protein
MSQDEIQELLRTFNDNASRLHGDFTPSVRRLTELGLPAIAATLHLLDDPNMMTRKRAQRVLDGVIMYRHGWEAGHGYSDPEQQGKVLALMKANGGYDAMAAPEERQQAIAKWRAWLEQEMADE